MNERIKKLRKFLKLTQQEFADRIGIKRGAIANYEVGRNEPADSVISLICREYSVDENWLRFGTGGDEPVFIEMATFSLDEFARQHNATELELEILKIYFELDPTVRDKITDHFKQRLAMSRQSSVADAEAAYIKSRSNTVQSTDLSASNTIDGTEKKSDAI